MLIHRFFKDLIHNQQIKVHLELLGKLSGLGLFIFLSRYIFQCIQYILTNYIGQVVVYVVDTYARYHYVNGAFPQCTWDCIDVNEPCRTTCHLIVIFVRWIIFIPLITLGYNLYWYIYLHYFSQIHTYKYSKGHCPSKDYFVFKDYTYSLDNPELVKTDLEKGEKVNYYRYNLVSSTQFIFITTNFVICYSVIMGLYSYEMVWYKWIPVSLLLPHLLGIVRYIKIEVSKFCANNHTGLKDDI